MKTLEMLTNGVRLVRECSGVASDGYGYLLRAVQAAVVSLYSQTSPHFPLEYECLTCSGEQLKHEYVPADFFFLPLTFCKPLEMVLLRQSSKQNICFNGFAGSAFEFRKCGRLLEV